MKLLEITCEPVQPTVINITLCTLKQMPHDITEVSVAISLLQGPINNVTVRLKVKNIFFLVQSKENDNQI